MGGQHQQSGDDPGHHKVVEHREDHGPDEEADQAAGQGAAVIKTEDSAGRKGDVAAAAGAVFLRREGDLITALQFERADVRRHDAELRDIERIILCGCGTASHAAMVGEYVIEALAHIPTEVEYASEFRYRNPPLNSDTLVLAITQSGETADTLAAVREAKAAGVLTIGIVNVVVGFAPLKPAEFVIIKLQQMAGGWAYNTTSSPSTTPGKFDVTREPVWFSTHKFDLLDEIIRVLGTRAKDAPEPVAGEDGRVDVGAGRTRQDLAHGDDRVRRQRTWTLGLPARRALGAGARPRSSRGSRR